MQCLTTLGVDCNPGEELVDRSVLRVGLQVQLDEPVKNLI
jgi:hypothetical protein